MVESRPAAPHGRKQIHDEKPQQVEGKLREIAGCPRCGASYRNGRWTWETAPIGSYEHVCPACERIDSSYPASELRVEGAFVVLHRDEVTARIRSVEERERREHPLKRIMAVEEHEDGLLVTFTDPKLAQSCGHALERAYAGRLELPATTGDKENLVRVRWSRD